MTEKREIKIDKFIVKSLLISFASSLLIFIFIEHFGKFSYQFYGGGKPHLTQLEGITYKTLLGNEVITDGKGYNVDDIMFTTGDFQESYFAKIPFYLKAIIADFTYFIILVIIIFITIMLRKKYSFKLT